MANNIFEEFDKMSEQIKKLDEKVDEIGDKSDLKAMSEQIKKINDKVDGISNTKIVYVDKEKEKHTWRNFVIKSKKEYCWFGHKEDFEAKQNLIILVGLALVITLLLSTILTSIAIKTYSTFSLLENIWLVVIIILIVKISLTDKEQEMFSFFKWSLYVDEFDGESILYKGRVKKRYYVFLILNCIAAVLNVIFLFTDKKYVFAIIVLILEIINIALSIIFFRFQYLPFFDSYFHLKLIGRGENSIEPVIIYFDMLQNKFYTEEEYYDTFKFMKPTREK